MLRTRRLFLVALLAALGWSQPLSLPNKADSVRFAVIGDTGTGHSEQYEVGEMLASYHQRFPFTFVIMNGDNLYGGESPRDFVKKFEEPYKPLLDAGVKFYASLGNHDDPLQRSYKYFNMNGERFYTFKFKNVQFLALDSNYMDKSQLEWLENQLSGSRSPWKIAFFHHPLYSSGNKHGSDLSLRAVLEPLLVKYGINVVFSGHEHFYERIKPQRGIYYFISGAGGQLRRGNIASDEMLAKGFDRDRHFMLVEISGDDLYFQTISRTGETVDSGVIHRQATSHAAASAP